MRQQQLLWSRSSAQQHRRDGFVNHRAAVVPTATVRVVQQEQDRVVLQDQQPRQVPYTRRTRMAGPSPVPPFADKTYAIVDGESDDIVAWAVDQASGEDTFVIKDSTIFQDRVLPRFFNHCNYSSFTRQLNNYGFTKVRSPTSSEAAGSARGGRSAVEASWWEFKHPNFRRGRRELLCEIKRREDKRTPSSSSSAAAERRGDGTSDEVLRGMRGELEHVKSDLQRVDRKLDELKHLVVRLLLHVEQRPESMMPAAVAPGAAGAGVESGSTFGAPYTQQLSSGSQQTSLTQHKEHEREQAYYHLRGSASSGSDERSGQPPRQHGHGRVRKGDVQQLGEGQAQLSAPSPRSRKRSLEGAPPFSHDSGHRHGSLGQLISAPARGDAGNRGGRAGGSFWRRAPESLGTGSASSDRVVGHGHWPRFRPHDLTSDARDTHQLQRREVQQYPPATSMPLMLSHPLPSPSPARSPVDHRPVDTGEVENTGVTERAGRPTRASWALPPPPPPPLPIQHVQQARLPFPGGDSDLTRRLTPPSPASSEAE